jgi:hypothetical protein
MREKKRLDLIKIVFSTHEKEEAVRKCVSDLIKYFIACGKLRNNLMHAKYSPPFFGGKEGKLHLDKRKKQSSSELHYMELDIGTLREAADSIRIGFDCCRELQWYLLCRDIPKPTARRWQIEIAVLPASLPQIPNPPNTFELSDKPHTPPLPPYLKEPYQA